VALLVIHVDDGAYFARHREYIAEDMKKLKRKYKLDHEPLNWYVGLKIDRKENAIFVSCKAYIETCYSRFDGQLIKPRSIPAVEMPQPWEGDSDCRTSYMELIGCLIYIANACRPDVSMITSALAAHLGNPSPDHMSIAKGVLSYLYQTRNKGLHYKKKGVPGSTDKNILKNMKLSACFDSDFITCKTRKSRSGILVYYNDCLVCWVSKKQTLRAMSVFEAETNAGCKCCIILLYMRKIQADFTMSNVLPIMIKMFGDNEKSIECAQNNSYGKRSKHFELRLFKMAECAEAGIVDLHHIRSTKNPADLLTKVAKANVFQNLISKLVIEYDA
jgi:hypothetical protein